ncbi:hypothetical protein HAX54_000103 [Datura stramonium]|uniref:Uncharacterized protein n=1 Tax=Datura stramonium TaxID=4076 RepID=A0ABS8RI13_DATST|nr:hypothetical protein [Datura stramonium]
MTYLRLGGILSSGDAFTLPRTDTCTECSYGKVALWSGTWGVALRNPLFLVHLGGADTPTRITGDSYKNGREVNSTQRHSGMDVDPSGRDNHFGPERSGERCKADRSVATVSIGSLFSMPKLDNSCGYFESLRMQLPYELEAKTNGFHFIGFMLRQFELARSVQLRPYNAIAFSGPIVVFLSVLQIYPLGQSSWFFAPSFGVAAIFQFILFFQGFHNWTLNPFHMMGVVGVLGVTLLCAIHGAIIEKTLFEDGDGANTFNGLSQILGKGDSTSQLELVVGPVGIMHTGTWEFEIYGLADPDRLHERNKTSITTTRGEAKLRRQLRFLLTSFLVTSFSSGWFGEREIKELWGRYAKDQIIEIVNLKRRKKRNLGDPEIAESAPVPKVKKFFAPFRPPASYSS